MKNIITLSALFVANFICAQAPNLMSYQSIVRNSSNAVVTNQSVGVKFSILKGSAAGQWFTQKPKPLLQMRMVFLPQN